MIRLNRTLKKIFWITLITSLVFILVFFLIQKSSKELDRNRIALIDSIGNNHIFRGNNPLLTKNGKKIFAYEELTSYFNDILQQQGLEPLSDYYLIDLSLLDLDQYYEINEENKFFIEHPEYGMVINISTLSPHLLAKENSPNSNFITTALAKRYNLWINDTLEKAHNIAANKTDRPTVVYIHCDSGRDRTGLMAASYKLLFKNMNLVKVRLENIAEVGRNSRKSYNGAINSYCLYVKEGYKKSDDYCDQN